MPDLLTIDEQIDRLQKWNKVVTHMIASIENRENIAAEFQTMMRHRNLMIRLKKDYD